MCIYLYLSLSYPVKTKIFIFLSPDRRNWNRGSCNTQIYTPKTPHHLHHSYSISIACVCIVYISLTHLWNIRWNVCSIVSILGFLSQIFRQRTNQELAWSSTPQGSHKDQEIPTIKNQAKDCTISRHLSLKILSATKLGFWSTETSRGKFSSENEPWLQNMIQYVQENPKGPFKSSHLPQRMHSPKIRN